MRTDAEFVNEILRDLDSILHERHAIGAIDLLTLGVLAGNMTRQGELCRRCGWERGKHVAGTLECPPTEGMSTRNWVPGQEFDGGGYATDGELLSRRLKELGAMD
jgi:hypothetical protein